MTTGYMRHRCIECQQHIVGKSARGLCKRCWDYAKRHGTLIDYPLNTTPRAHFLADFELLVEEGYTLRQIAERLGMTYEAVDQAQYRARLAGATEHQARRAGWAQCRKAI